MKSLVLTGCAVAVLSAGLAANTGVPVTRVGAINWDCSLPSTTFFGHYATQSLGPEKFRDRTPYYAKVVGKDRIDYADRTARSRRWAPTAAARRRQRPGRNTAHGRSRTT